MLNRGLRCGEKGQKGQNARFQPLAASDGAMAMPDHAIAFHDGTIAPFDARMATSDRTIAALHRPIAISDHAVATRYRLIAASDHAIAVLARAIPRPDAAFAKLPHLSTPIPDRLHKSITTIQEPRQIVHVIDRLD